MSDATGGEREFFLPVHVEDLESYEKMGEHRYVIDEVQDVSLLNSDDQIGTLRALFHELTRSPVLHIQEPSLIGTLYSFVKALPMPGVVCKEARALMVHECAEKLNRLLVHTTNYIRREGDRLNLAALLAPRSCVKMYVFAIAHTLLSHYSGEGDAAGVGLPLSQATGRTAKGRGRRGGPSLASDEDTSGVDVSGREQAVIALSRLYDPAIVKLWREEATVEDQVLTLTIRLLMHLMSQKVNIDGDHNAVATSIFALLTASGQSITSQFLRSEALREAEGTPNTSPDPKDLLVTPLVELLLKHLYMAKFLARWVSSVDAAETVQGQWAAPLLQTLFEHVVVSACDDVAGDTQSARHITLFMEELSRTRITFVCKFPDAVVTLLQAESYEVRKAGITVSTEVVVQRFAGFLRDPDDERRRDTLLRELLSRTLDLNPFTRTHCLHQWGELVRRKAVPRSFFLSLVEYAVGRLEDRNYLVRNSALQLLAEIMRRNWFSTVLSRESNRERFAHHTAEVRQKYKDLGKTEAEFLDAWTAARASLRPVDVEANHPLEAATDDVVVGDVEPDVLLQEDAQPEIRLSQRSNRGGDDSNGPSPGASAVGGEDLLTGGRPSGTLRMQQHDPEMIRLVYFENALVCIGLLERALAHAVTLLDSKNERNVIEAIRFIVVSSEYHLEGSTQAVLRFLVMIFEGEAAIQAAVREGFYAVFFHCFITLLGPNVSPMRRAAASALKIISVLKLAGEGEVNAMDRLFRTMKQEGSRALSDQFYDAVWSIVDGSIDANAPAGGAANVVGDPVERRTALRLYAMLVAVSPRDIVLRKPALLTLLNRCSNDNGLLCFGFQCLQHEALSRGYILIDEKQDPNEHPVLSLIVRSLCRPTSRLGSWMPMAEAGINAIHLLCKTPIILYVSIVQFLVQSIQCMEGATLRDLVAGLSDADVPRSRRVAQLLFILGNTCLKHMISIEAWERAQLKAMEENERTPPAAAAAATPSGARSARNSAVLPPAGAAAPGEPLDVMHKELGMGSSAAKRHEIEDAGNRKKRAMFEEKTSLWAQYAPVCVKVCKQLPQRQLPELRVAATLCLTKLMVASPDFCGLHLPLLFTIASNAEESWVTKTNVLLGIGDLACVHPNLVEPYMRLKDKGLFALLKDEDSRVRSVTIQICSHLVLSEMLRIGDRLHCVVRLVADEDPTIRSNALAFVKNFALKNRKTMGNMIPPMIPVLTKCLSAEAFEEPMKAMLEKVEKDKPTESLIEKLCERFGSYTEKSVLKKKMARNLAFCLSELDFTSEKVFKKISSNHCYDLYRQWLRDDDVRDYFLAIAAKARKAGGSGVGVAGRQAAAAAAQAGGERRDRATIDEWEARIIADAAIVTIPCAETANTQQGTRSADRTAENATGGDGAAVDLDGGQHSSPAVGRRTKSSGRASGKRDRDDSDDSGSSSSDEEEVSNQLKRETNKEAGHPKGGRQAAKPPVARGRKQLKQETPESSSDSDSTSEEEEAEAEAPQNRRRRQPQPPVAKRGRR